MKEHFKIRETSRLKIVLSEYAIAFILFIIIALIIPDGMEVFIEGGLYYVIGLIIIAITFLIEICIIVFCKNNPTILSIEEKGVELRVMGKIRRSYQKRFSEALLMRFEWSEIEYIKLCIDPMLPYKDVPEMCIHIKPKEEDEVWGSIEDYCLGRSSTSRCIQRVVSSCTGRPDLFIDER